MTPLTYADLLIPCWPVAAALAIVGAAHLAARIYHRKERP
jgi:hypothetical protein